MNSLSPIEFSLPNLTFRGVTNHAGEELVSNKPLMIALHGWLDNAHSFLPLLPYLDDYTVIALDWAGHGLSSHRPNGTDYHQLDYIDDLNQLIEQQQWSKLTLLGHSMGGILSCIYAAVYPEHVNRVICLDALGPLVEAEDETVSGIKAGIASRRKTAAPRNKKGRQLVFRNLVAKRAEISCLSESLTETLLSRSVDTQDATVLSGDSVVTLRTDQRLRQQSLLRLTPGQAKAIVAAIECPVTAVIASEGFVIKRNLIDERRDWFRSLSVKHIAGEHHVHMQKPAEISALIKREDTVSA